MAAKDYNIVVGFAGAYIAKISKRNPIQMLTDRRVIKESEIFMLIDWLLDLKWGNVNKDGGVLCFDSRIREGMIVEIKFTDKGKIEKL